MDLYDEINKYIEDLVQYIIDEFSSYNIYFKDSDLEGGSVNPVYDIEDGALLSYEANKIMHLYKSSDPIERDDGSVLVKFINHCISQFIKDNSLDKLQVYFDEMETIVSIFPSVQRISIWWTIEFIPIGD